MEGDTAGKHQNSLRAAEAMRRFCHRLTSVFFALPPFKPLLHSHTPQWLQRFSIGAGVIFAHSTFLARY